MPDKDLEGYLTEPSSAENLPIANEENLTLNDDFVKSTNLPISDNTLPLSYSGANSLIAAAIPLITLYTTLQNSSDCTNLQKLRDYTVAEIKNFDKSAQSYNINPKITLAARYLLCTALDEIVLSSDWGNKSAWSRQSLLSFFHKETFGGDRFFIIVDFMSKDPSKNADLLELAYVLISLGFKGKYYANPTDLSKIKNNLFDLIANNHTAINTALSQYEPLKISNANVFITHIPVWVMVAVTAVIFLFALIISNYQVVEKSFPLYQELSTIASGKSIKENNNELALQ